MEGLDCRSKVLVLLRRFEGDRESRGVEIDDDTVPVADGVT